jgi:mevalonate kinase
MPAISASAPGKVILFGEHAVVYNRPAIAVPVNQVQAHAVITANPLAQPGTIWIEAPEVRLNTDLSHLPHSHHFWILFDQLKDRLEIRSFPALKMRVTSSIPVAAGLGSGAAVSVACARALSSFVGHPLPDRDVNAIAYEVEKHHHGTPSGIDNTVITYAKPIYFERGKPIETLAVAAPIHLVIAHCGLRSSTAEAVGAVREAWQQAPEKYEALFDQIGDLTRQARTAIEQGLIDQLGPLMTTNHTCLREIGVSIPMLDRLVETALNAGAYGAKLSGAGRGGNMIALVTDQTASTVAAALGSAGATSVITTTVQPGQAVQD